MAYPYLTSLNGAWTSTIDFALVDVAPADPPYPGGGQGAAAKRQYVGGFVPQARMPRFPTGHVPQLHTPPDTLPDPIPELN
jgi:hypothetical protein